MGSETALPPAPAPSWAPASTVSVAMATYNGERFIEQQFDSILAQTEAVDEIVVTDDGSTDRTVEIVRSYAARTSVPVKVTLNESRLGFARNFARAIGLCSSDLIFLCDQDDVWSPEKVAIMKRALSKPGVLLACHGATLIDAENRTLGPFDTPQQERARAPTRMFHPWYSSYGLTQAFRSELRAFDDLWPQSLNHVAMENEILSHDQWYYFLAHVLGEIDYVDEPLVLYRQHGGNAVGADKIAPEYGPLERLKARLKHSPEHDALRSRAAKRRAVILEQLAARLEPDRRARPLLIADMYAQLAERLARRHDTYTGAAARSRLGSFVQSLAKGDYRHHPWGFDPRSVVRDVIAGVAAPRLVHKRAVR